MVLFNKELTYNESGSGWCIDTGRKLDLQEVAKIESYLLSKSADQIRHINETLLPHLVGTYELLKQWGNPVDICLAGLLHTSYGTEGVTHAFFDSDSRDELVKLIGKPAEELVWFYGRCDRAFMYSNIIEGHFNAYLDRYSGAIWQPAQNLLSAFLELTFANELEILRRTPFTEEARMLWSKRFLPCKEMVSQPAYDYFLSVLG